MQALAEIKQGDPARALQTLDGLQPVSVPGRLAQALALSGAAGMGFADPALGTVKAAECRTLALATGERSTLVVASWAQAAAAHARDDLHAASERTSWTRTRCANVGFHLFDRIYGARIAAAGDPAVALARVEEAERAVRGPLETCPGCRITLAVPAAIASARAGDRRRASCSGSRGRARRSTSRG